MTNLQIITNNNERHFLYGFEVPKSVLTDQFDYLDDDMQSDGFIHYRGIWYHTSDFMRIENHPDTDFSSWHGYSSDSYFSGVLIRLSDDGETYQIATYIS